jgi:hypothetical protein
MIRILKYLLAETIKNGFQFDLNFYMSDKMADTKTTIMENIFREMITVIGYEKALEIVTNAKPTTDKPPKAAPKAEPKKVDEEKKKRIPRMSPTLATQLKTELGKVGLKYSEDDKKEFDKIKKEFVAYVDDLTDDDFAVKGLTEHMNDFANSKKPAEEKVEKKTEEVKVVKTEDKPKKGGKKKEDPPKKEEVHVPPSNAANIHTLTLEELQGIEMTAVLDGEDHAGIYWDADNGRYVRGPDADEDEDIVEAKFRGKTYMVGEKTGRVYEETDNRDVFHGFVGVGQFREMKMP